MSHGARCSPWIERIRKTLAKHVYDRLPGDVAAMTAARLNGEQSGISSPVIDSMRIAGLAHLLSTSGFHVTIMALLIYFPLRALLALSPWLALRYPIKKWAATAAIISALGYTFLVGSQAATLRSMIMVGLVLLAIMTDRRAAPLRLVMMSAAIALLLAPDAALGPSFQMSFAAVFCLIAANAHKQASTLAEYLNFLPVIPVLSLLRRRIARTSLIATAATTPFAIYHFQSFSLYGFARHGSHSSHELLGDAVHSAGLCHSSLRPRRNFYRRRRPRGRPDNPHCENSRRVAALNLFLARHAGCRIPRDSPWRLMAVPVAREMAVYWLGPHSYRNALPTLHNHARHLCIPKRQSMGRKARRRTPSSIERQTRKIRQRAMAGKAGKRSTSSRQSPSFRRQTNWLRRLRLRHSQKGRPYCNADCGSGSLEDCQHAALIIAPFIIKDCAATPIDRAALDLHGAHTITFADGNPRLAFSRKNKGTRPWSVEWRKKKNRRKKRNNPNILSAFCSSPCRVPTKALSCDEDGEFFMRKETDALGTLEIEENVLWGVHTERALDNFKISDKRAPYELIAGIATVKQAAVLANAELGYLSKEIADALADACEKIRANEKEYASSFPIDGLQGGAGTSTEHECQRSYREPGVAPWDTDARRLRTASIRYSRQSASIDQRRLPDRR